MEVLAAKPAGNEQLANFYVERFLPMYARLTMHGWRKDLLKIRTPIRIHLCQGSTNRGARAKLRTRPRRLRSASRKPAPPAASLVSTSRTLFCLPQFFSSPARRENSSSDVSVPSHLASPPRFSSLLSFARPCFLYEIRHSLLRALAQMSSFFLGSPLPGAGTC